MTTIPMVRRSPSSQALALPRRSWYLALFLLSRPYSWTDMVLNGLFGGVLAIGGTRTRDGEVALLHVGLLVLLFWCLLNWTSERVQRDRGRIRPPVVGTVLIAVLGLWLALMWGGLTALGLGVVFLVLSIVYPYKACTRWLGPIGPVLRGGHTACIVAIGYYVAGGTGLESWLPVMGLAIIQTARSWLGDVRDRRRDRFELPKRADPRIVVVLCCVLLVVGIGFLPGGWERGVLAVEVIGIGLFILRFGLDGAYEGHLLFVVLSATYKLLYLAPWLDVTWIACLAVGTAVGIPTYWLVPRPENHSFRRRWADAIGLNRSDRLKTAA